jgi:hypothetical protein
MDVERLEEPFDAAICTLGLSVIPEWQRAWEAMVSAVRPGGRVAIMDAGCSERPGRTGHTTIPRPLAWTLSRLFAADCGRRPRRLLQGDTTDPTREQFTWGLGRRRGGRQGVSARAHRLHETADRQIAELTDRLSAADKAALGRPCPGRAGFGDGTVGAVAAHTTDNYHRMAQFAAGVHSEPDDHSRQHSASDIEMRELLGRLAAARHAFARIRELSDDEIDAVPTSGAIRFADGTRTLEQVLVRLLKHQRHQIDALIAALS